jgi:hypothetical protein
MASDRRVSRAHLGVITLSIEEAQPDHAAAVPRERDRARRSGFARCVDDERLAAAALPPADCGKTVPLS